MEISFKKFMIFFKFFCRVAFTIIFHSLDLFFREYKEYDFKDEREYLNA